MADRNETAKTAPEAGTPLNPALRKVHDDSYGEEHTGTDPMETVSKRRGGDGGPWPLIWAAVVILCVVATIILIV